MSTKKRVFIIVGSVLGGLLCVLIAGIIVLTVNGRMLKVGTYMGDGYVLFGNAPMTTVEHTGDDELFAGLQPGDRILVLRDSSELASYPAMTGMYRCVKLKGGEASDIPEEIWHSFRGERADAAGE